MEKSSTAVQMVSTSTKESSSLEKTLPVTVRLQWRIAVDGGLLDEQSTSGPLPTCLNSLGHLEAVARPAHCLQITRVLRIALDLLTDTPHIDIDRARRHEACIAPHRIQQMVAAEDAPRMPRQVVQQAELRSRRGRQLARTFSCIALASMTTSSKLITEGADGRSKRRSTAFTRATSSRMANGLVM